MVAALSETISVLIGMRVLQAAGGSAMLTIGGGTLAVRPRDPAPDLIGFIPTTSPDVKH